MYIVCTYSSEGISIPLLFAINTRICAAAACIRIALKHHVYALKSFLWIKTKKTLHDD